MEVTAYQTALCMSQNTAILISFLVTDEIKRSNYGACAKDSRNCVAVRHRTESEAATLDLMRNLVSQFKIHVPASPDVLNELCRNHSNIFLDRVHHFDMWALKSKHLDG